MQIDKGREGGTLIAGLPHSDGYASRTALKTASALRCRAGTPAHRAHDFYQRTRAHPEWNVEVVGFAEDGDVPFDARLDAALVHKLSNLPDLLSAGDVDEVLSALPRSQLFELAPIAEVCGRAGVPLMILADLFGADLPPPRTFRRPADPALLCWAGDLLAAALPAWRRNLPDAQAAHDDSRGRRAQGEHPPSE